MASFSNISIDSFEYKEEQPKGSFQQIIERGVSDRKYLNQDLKFTLTKPKLINAKPKQQKKALTSRQIIKIPKQRDNHQNILPTTLTRPLEEKSKKIEPNINTGQTKHKPNQKEGFYKVAEPRTFRVINDLK